MMALKISGSEEHPNSNDFSWKSCLFFNVFVRGVFVVRKKFFRRYFGSFVGSEVQSVK